MKDAFRSKLKAKVDDYRTWSAGRQLSSGRFVHYCGVELLGAHDLPLTDVEARIEGLICEGFYVDWAEHGGRLVLRVWELGGPEPEWRKVFAEQPLADLKELLPGAEE
jgi:hypothetical protein